MPTVDLLVKNARIVTPNGVMDGGVAVDEGKIVAVTSDTTLLDSSKVIDAAGLLLLPGLVDPECHMGATRPIMEDMISETRAAGAAGVTTWGLMQTSPTIKRPVKDIQGPDDVPSFKEVLPEGIRIGEQNSLIDFYFTPILQTNSQAEEIPDYASQFGVTTYKYYLHQKNPKHSKYWPMKVGFVSYDDRAIYLGMENAAKLAPRGRVCMHCENWEIASIFEDRLIAANSERTAATWDDKSPHFCEAHHVRSYAYLGKVTGCPIYIQHTTTQETIDEIRRARAEGIKIMAQTGHHYLSISKHDGWRINVPLRDPETIARLWIALAKGDIDCVGTDHIAHGPREQLEVKDDAWSVKGGFSSRVEALFPVMMDEGVNKGRITIERLVQVCCENTAKAFGLYPKKGVIAIGADADLLLVDPKRVIRVSSEMLHTCTGWSIYEGREFQGWPTIVISRGEIIAERPKDKARAEIIGKSGRGKYLRREVT